MTFTVTLLFLKVRFNDFQFQTIKKDIMFTIGKIKAQKEPPNIDAVSKILYPSLQRKVDLVEVNSDNSILLVTFSYF